MEINERTKLAFDFAKEVTKQILTLATAIVTLTLTFTKEFVSNDTIDVEYVYFAWIAFLISIIFGLWTLLALTGTLGTGKKGVAVSIEGFNIKFPFF